MQTAFEIPRGQKRPERLLFLAYFEPRSVPTIESNIAFYQQHSEYQVLVLNLAEHRADSGALKIPPHIVLSEFDAVIIHNTVGYSAHNLVSLDAVLDEKLKDFTGAKIILKQDEHHLFNAFATYAAEVGFDRIFTVMPESEWPKTYGKLLPGVTLCPMLTGYVMPWQRQAPDLSAPRTVDIGYRGSIMPLSFGRLCYDKRRIGDEVLGRLAGEGLSLDISSAWEDRIGGEDWHTFLSSCKAVLGVESGAGVFDFDGTLDETCHRIEADLGADDGTHEYALAYLAALGDLDGAVRYYALSPRHFEAIAAGAIQILLPGHFSGRMQAGRHYFELAPDYSNLGEAVSLLTDDAARTELAQCAFEEVVLDPANWIETFVSELDGALTACLAEKPRPARAGKLEYQATSPEAAHNIVILQAHQFGLDPRRDSWYAAGAPDGMIFHNVGVAPETPTAEITNASGKLAVEAPRLRWRNGCLDVLARQLAGDPDASAVIRELYFLEYARKQSDTALFDLFGFPQGKQIETFRWFIDYLLDNALTLSNAISNAQGIHGIVAINLPSLLPAILMGRLHNVPVIYEALEYWPEADPRQCNAMYHFWKNLESRIARMADLHGTVSPQLAERMTREFDARFDSVPNVVPLADARVPDRETAIAPGDGKVRFLYQGNFAKHRGLEELISCWGDADPRAHLYLRGPGNEYHETLRTLAKEQNCLDRNVHFIDAVPMTDLIAAARADADVGIIPYPPVGANYAACSPNKMGQYFAAGIPILANRTAFVARTVTGANAGQVVDFSRRSQLLAAICELCDAATRAQYAQNAGAHFEAEFHWESQAAGFYSRILQALEQRTLTPATSFALSMLRSLPEIEPEPVERRRRSLCERLSRSIEKRWRWLTRRVTG